MKSRIPIYEPWVAATQEENVLACLRENWISSKGRFIDKFEKHLCDYTGLSAITSCSNGTTALHLALLALGLKEGDEILVPSFAYVAAVNAISYVGATPRFVDIDPFTWNICSVDAENKISSKTKAIICIHTYGVPCEIKQLRELADQNSLYLIEDSAEALGSFYAGKHIGTVADICTFSFFGNKTITTGEGGAVGSRNPDIISTVVKLKNQGLVQQGRYDHDIVGYNYRMTNVQAAIGVAQLAEVKKILNLKCQIADRYRSDLKGLVEFQVCDTQYCSNWINTVKFGSITKKKEVEKALQSNNIEVRPGFPRVDKMPMYKDEPFLPVTHELTDRLLCLPSYPSISEDQQTRVIQTITNIFKSK